MTAVAHDGQLALPPAAAPTRRNIHLVGTIFAIAAGAMLVGGLLAAYFGARASVHAAGNDWLPQGTTLPNVALAVSYFSLVMSSFTAQWAVSAIKLDDRRQGYVAVGLTLLLAAAFLNGMTFCWAQLHMAAGDGGFADHMYALTGVHVLLVVAALVLWVVMAFRVLGGQFDSRNSEFVASAAAFWHFAVVAGIAIWWCVWFLEGGPTS
jgi:heme/copper-type cytochrome/quinol oxidase subunit 3